MSATAAIIEKVDASELAVEDFDLGGGAGGGAATGSRSSGGGGGSHKKRTSVTMRPATVLDADGNPVVALVAADGTYLKATLSEDGQLKPMLGPDGAPMAVVGPGGAPAQEIGGSDSRGGASGATSPIQVMRFVPTTVLGANGAPIAALVGPDGQAVKAVINEVGQLEPFLDANGPVERGKPFLP